VRDYYFSLWPLDPDRSAAAKGPQVGVTWIRCGVELEFVAPYPDAVAAQLPPRWSYEHTDVEAISPVLTSRAEAVKELAAVCAVLKDLGAGTHESKGLHVHLSREDLGPAGIARLLARYYAELPALNDRWPERRRALFDGCGLIATGQACEHCRPACGPHRTLATVEVRQHPSTLDPGVVLAWLDTLMGWAAEVA
jgi:hypothetical protein